MVCYNGGMNFSERKSAGVKFQSYMMDFANRLAREQQRIWSFCHPALVCAVAGGAAQGRGAAAEGAGDPGLRLAMDRRADQ